MTNGKIEAAGFAALLAMSRIFTEAASLPGEGTEYGMQRFTVIVLSFLLTAAVYLPLILVISKSGGQSPVAVIAGRSKLLSGFFGVLLTAGLLAGGAETGLRAHYYASGTVFDSAPSAYFYIFTGAALLFAVYKGVEASSRMCTFTLVGFAVLLILILVTQFPAIRLNRLYPAFADDADKLIAEVMKEFSHNNEYIIFALLCGDIRKRSALSVPMYLGAAGLIILFMTFMYNTVFGRLVSRLDFPFYTLSSVSDMALLHRINGIDAMVWVMAGLLRLALFAFAFGNIVRLCFAGERIAGIASAVFAVLTLVLSGLFTAYPDMYKPVERILSTGLPLLVTAVILPAAAFICTHGRKAAKQ